MAAPRRWGYTPRARKVNAEAVGCPTQVGIYPQEAQAGYSSTGLPHAGGDIPRARQERRAREMAAPRRWGYTRFPDIPEKSFRRLPHAGGDIPRSAVGLARRVQAAPRRWGYTATVLLHGGAI